MGLAVSLERNDILLHGALAAGSVPSAVTLALAGVLARLIKTAAVQGGGIARDSIGAAGSRAARELLREAAGPGKRTAGERRDRRSGATQGALRSLAAAQGAVLVGAAAHRAGGGILRWGDVG